MIKATTSLILSLLLISCAAPTIDTVKNTVENSIDEFQSDQLNNQLPQVITSIDSISNILDGYQNHESFGIYQQVKSEFEEQKGSQCLDQNANCLRKLYNNHLTNLWGTVRIIKPEELHRFRADAQPNSLVVSQVSGYYQYTEQDEILFYINYASLQNITKKSMDFNGVGLKLLNQFTIQKGEQFAQVGEVVITKSLKSLEKINLRNLSFSIDESELAIEAAAYRIAPYFKHDTDKQGTNGTLLKVSARMAKKPVDSSTDEVPIEKIQPISEINPDELTDSEKAALGL